MEWLAPHIAQALLIVVVVLVISEALYRVFGIMIGDMQDKLARPRFRKSAFTGCVVLAFGMVFMSQRQWFDMISTPLAVLGSWGLIKLFSALTDRFGEK